MCGRERDFRVCSKALATRPPRARGTRQRRNPHGVHSPRRPQTQRARVHREPCSRAESVSSTAARRCSSRPPASITGHPLALGPEHTCALGAGPPSERRSGKGAHLCSRCGTPFRMQVQDGGTPVLQVGPPSGHRSGQQGSAGHLPGVDFPCVCRFLARYSGKSESEGSRLRADARAPSLNDGRPE